MSPASHVHESRSAILYSDWHMPAPNPTMSVLH
jgi:hypothetical protein